MSSRAAVLQPALGDIIRRGGENIRNVALCELFAAVCPRGQMPKIAVRDMRTRWGSCSLKTGTLAFAQRLCVMPPAAQEYVVVHEFCHFAHPNHSPAFWAAVEKVLPDYRQREKLLKMR